jgi:hypothetical protein
MEAAIREKCPYKIDIGAVYNVDVRGFYLHYIVWQSFENPFLEHIFSMVILNLIGKLSSS